MPDTTSPWEEWRPGRNPYRRTPFQVLGLSVDLKGPAAIKAAIRRRRQRIQTAPERFPLFGDLLDVAQVNEAEEWVLDPRARLYAELCTHRPRRLRLDLGDARQDLEELTIPIPDVPYAVAADRLARLVPPPAQRRFAPLIDW